MSNKLIRKLLGLDKESDLLIEAAAKILKKRPKDVTEEEAEEVARELDFQREETWD